MLDLYQYLFKNYITYDSLYALNKKAFYERSDATEVDIFIDMASLINDIFTMPFEFNYNSTSVLSSSIINLCAHLREYYFRYHKVWAKFYIVWSWNRPDNVRATIPEYNAHLIMAQDAKGIQRTMVNENIAILNVLCPCLPDIYFFDGGNHETTTIIAALITKFKDNVNNERRSIPNIIYTRDSYAYLAVQSIPLTFIFRPKKLKGVDCSYMVSKTNLVESYIDRELKQVHYNRTSNYEDFHKYIAHSGLKARGVKGVLKFKQAIAYITNDTKQLFFSNYELERINCLHQAFNIWHQLQIYYNSVDYVSLNRGLININNPEEVKKINDIYFTDYPLDLNVL